MPGVGDDPDGRRDVTATWIEVTIRLAVLGLLLYLSFTLIQPFITIAIWSIVLTVALYPVYDWMVRHLRGRRRLAAALLTLISLLIIIGPATWLALGLIDSVGTLLDRFDLSTLALPPPPESIRTWPLIGEPIYQFWNLASTNLREALGRVAPHLRPVGAALLQIAAEAGTGTIKFFIAIFVAGFLFSPAPSLVETMHRFSRRLVAGRGEEFVDLAGATIRTVARGVIGISALQAFFAGIGFVAAGIPGASLLTSAVLILGIIQIGPSIIIIPLIIWSLVFNGDDGGASLHRLHDPGQPDGQRPAAACHGAGPDHADVGHSDRRDRWRPLLRGHRAVSRPDRSCGDLGAAGRLDQGA
jgi:predicted PurR-regulated permease PerM